jgi:hypothetical protein
MNPLISQSVIKGWPTGTMPTAKLNPARRRVVKGMPVAEPARHHKLSNFRKEK